MKQIYETSLKSLLRKMTTCYQAENLNMLQHGKSVYKEYCKLICQLSNGVGDATLLAVYSRIKDSLPPPSVLKRYMVLHDCGKHLCLSIDESGKRHFPDHAQISAEQFLMIYPQDKFSSILISKDMDFHLARGEQLESIWKDPFAPILYLSAWASINANAEMFGGKQSDSYKIKRSRLIQAGKKYLNSIKEN